HRRHLHPWPHRLFPITRGSLLLRCPMESDLPLDSSLPSHPIRPHQRNIICGLLVYQAGVGRAHTQSLLLGLRRSTTPHLDQICLLQDHFHLLWNSQNTPVLGLFKILSFIKVVAISFGHLSHLVGFSLQIPLAVFAFTFHPL